MKEFKKRITRLVTILIILTFFVNTLLNRFYVEVYEYNEEKKPIITNMDQVSQMSIQGTGLRKIAYFCEQNGIDFSGFLANYMAFHNYNVESIGYDFEQEYYNDFKGESYKWFYHMLFDPVKCFPVKCNNESDYDRYEYSNSFLAPRTYGGDRKHMGIDIMDVNDESGYFQIVSMTDGVVENMGWLELGGYRVGIRTEEGVYFYYAHLERYAEGLEKGMSVKAGQLLGYMGSTGYGQEGTDDQFPVHLHVGICIMHDGEEVWINPYPILQMLDPAI